MVAAMLPFTAPATPLAASLLLLLLLLLLLQADFGVL
jgi:hypothetical protein